MDRGEYKERFPRIADKVDRLFDSTEPRRAGYLALAQELDTEPDLNGYGEIADQLVLPFQPGQWGGSPRDRINLPPRGSQEFGDDVA